MSSSHAGHGSPDSESLMATSLRLGGILAAVTHPGVAKMHATADAMTVVSRASSRSGGGAASVTGGVAGKPLRIAGIPTGIGSSASGSQLGGSGSGSGSGSGEGYGEGSDRFAFRDSRSQGASHGGAPPSAIWQQAEK